MTTTATVPAARLIPVEPESEAWHEARRAGVTASEIAVLLGISPFDSPFNLYWRKLGTLPDDYDNDRLSLGRHLEPWVADRFAEQHPEFILQQRPGLFASVERPWQMATPDGLIQDAPSSGVVERDGVFDVEHLAVWEGKTSGTYDGWGDDGTDEILAYIRAQVLWQMDVMGVGCAYVSCLFLATQKTRHYEIGYDAADVQLMRDAAREFMFKLYEETPPPIDSHPATTVALKALHPVLDEDATATIPDQVAEDYRWAHAQLKAAKEQAAHADNQVRAAMADARYAVDEADEKVCSRSIYEVAAHEVAAFTVDKLNPSRRKKTTS
jgi:putative phage-type endonuclease